MKLNLNNCMGKDVEKLVLRTFVGFVAIVGNIVLDNSLLRLMSLMVVIYSSIGTYIDFRR